MLFALGAVSSALDALQALTSQKSSSTQQTGFTQGATNPFSIEDGQGTSSSGASSSVNSGNARQIAPQTMSALIAAQSQPSPGSTTTAWPGSTTKASPGSTTMAWPGSTTRAQTPSTSSSPTSRQDALKDLFSKIDANGDGKITKSEFENALGAGGTNLAQADDVFSKLDANSDGRVSLDEMSKALQSGHHGHPHVQGASGSGNGGDSSNSSQSSGGSTRTTAVNSDGSITTTVKYADGFKVTTTVPGASSASGAGNSPYNWFEQMMQGQTGSSSAASSLSMSV